MKIGTKRFYAQHGVVTLVAVEDREFGGSKEEFHVLELMGGGTILVPTKAMDDKAFRPLVTAKKAKELLKRVMSKAKPKVNEATDNSTKARSAYYADQLKTGDPSKYTEVLRELMYRERNDKISSSEAKLVETARRYFIAEIGCVLKITAEKLTADLDAAAVKP